MKRKSKGDLNDDLRPHYALRQLLPGGVQGKYADRYRTGTNLVLLEPDIAKAFSSDEEVNEALRLVLQVTQIRLDKKQRLQKQKV